VATLHDAAIRHEFQVLRVAHKQVLQPLAIRHARGIVSVSAFARDEAVRHFGADARRVHVVHSGPGFAPARSASAGSLEADSPARVGADSPLPDGPYLLYVGNFIAHKNLPFLIQAFTAADVPARLLLIGSWGDGLEPVRDAIAASPAADRIELRSGTSDADLDQLYRGARALLLPSLYEGFGFTALEAMDRECAVLASDIPALREVCGDGAWLLPPTDAAAWAQAIRTVLGAPARVEELRRAGSKAVAGYSWERTARGVCDVLLRAGDAAG
jgi:glycosyltransferase involved in cell wall biosynthesis